MPKWIGALVLGSLLTGAAAMPAQAAQYAVNDFILGTQLPAAAFRDYRCGPSEQFDGFVWCQRNRPGSARRGPFSVTQSLLHSRDGKIAYINRQQNPVVFDGNDAEDDIRSFSRRFGSQPRITKLPRRGGLEGMMALWGDVTVEPLDDDSVKVLADGRSPRKGFLVDYVGNLTKSAQDGLPIFRITGGAGFIWAASFDQRGRGTLRLTAVDASVLSPPVADAPPPKPVAESPSPEPAPAQVATAAEPPSGTSRVRTEIVDPTVRATETPQPDGKAEPQVAEPPAKVESEKVEPPVNVAQVDVESTKAETARFDVQAAETKGTGVAGEASGINNELGRLRTATRLAFAIVAGLLIALVATLLMIFGRRKRANNAMLAANAKRGSVATAVPSPSVSPAEAAGPRLPTYAPAAGGGPSTVVHTVFDSPVAARAAATTRRVSEPPAVSSHDAPDADPAPPAPAAMEEQSQLSIVPDDPPDAVETVAHDPPATDDPVQRLVELAKLRASGMLTESEFNQLKASIIAATARENAASSDRPPHTAL